MSLLVCHLPLHVCFLPMPFNLSIFASPASAPVSAPGSALMRL